MNTLTSVTCLSALLSASIPGQTVERGKTSAAEARPSPLEQEVQHYVLTDRSLIDGLAELSQSAGVRLNLGIEEILRERLQSPRDRSAKISLHLEHASLRDILNALCDSDPRYAWSTDGFSINVYPRARADDKSDLLNFQIQRIELNAVPDPDQALTPLSKLFPGEQVGYMQFGGDNSYSEPWTVAFEHLTVRQLMDRITEHIGPHAMWSWQGGKDGRMFTFLRGGFHTDQSQ